MTEAAESIAVCDAGPLIHLDELGCLSLLGDFSRVLVPSTVWAEVATHRPDFARDASPNFERVRPAGRIPFEIETLAKLLVLNPVKSRPCGWPPGIPVACCFPTTPPRGSPRSICD